MPEPDVILDAPKGIYNDVIMHLSKDKGTTKKSPVKMRKIRKIHGYRN